VVYLGSEHHIALVFHSPANDCGVFLIRFEKPFLMWGKRGAVLLVWPGMEGMREHIAIEAHAGFKEGGWVLDAIANEGG
jgi:hypothetical protein